MSRIAIVGTGAWGTALAMHAARTGHAVTLLGRRPELVSRLREGRQHPALAGAPPIPDGVELSADPAAAFDGAEAVLWSVSVQATGQEASRLKPHLPARSPIVSTSKGLEIGTKRRTTEVIRQVLGRDEGIAALSGPTFAAEVARGLPAAAVVASIDGELSASLQALLSSPSFRLYRSSDVLGVEISGASKNVVAIAAGLVDGLKLGQNTRAALLTRALAEIRRLGLRLGGQAETFSGLAGAGDLILTATGDLSRNRRVGLALASGLTLEAALASLGGEVAEGVPTAASLVELAREHEVELPIAEAVVEILEGRIPPRDAVFRLMTRGLKEERA